MRAALGEGIEAMLLAQWIQCRLLVCVHRYLAEILEERMGYSEPAFWAAAERAVAGYHERFEDELGLRFALFDVEAPAFVEHCLDRVRILGRSYADDAQRPVAPPRRAGSTIRSPPRRVCAGAGRDGRPSAP